MSDILVNADTATAILPQNKRLVNMSRTGVVTGLVIGNTLSSPRSDSIAKHFTIGVGESLTQGSPSVPSLKIGTFGMWRFRWGLVSIGLHQIQCRVNQTYLNGPVPTMVVKANPTIGVGLDVTISASAVSGWQTLAPAQITNTAAGVVWVELWNNDSKNLLNPAYFDHVTAI